MVYVGIDLGTTYSCVSVVEDGKPVAIINEDGKPTMPSVVAYCEPEILAGNPALMCNTDVTNILYDSKRLIGWKFLHDLPNAESRQLWTFNVDTRNSRAGYVLSKGTAKEKFLKPEEVSAEILKKLKANAEKHLSTKVAGAVVTVPALFNSDQIEATKRAVKSAGLELKYLLEEPTSAAIAYNHKKKFENSKLLIFDFGGGTLDISIAEIKDKNLEVKAVGGDTQLGGQDFDGKIMNYSIDEFSKSSSNYDIVNKPKLIRRLRTACKEGKEALSFNLSSYNIHIDINDELDLNVGMTPNKLNELCNELYTKAMRQVDNVLNTAQLKASQIDHVILVGGMTRIPFLQQKLADKFGRNKLKFDINPDEAVAYGAAIVANALEKGIAMPLINNTMNELARNINSLQIGGDNSVNNSHDILFYLLYQNNNGTYEGRIGLFNSYTSSVEEIAKFHNWYAPFKVAATQNKIFGINGRNKSFEIYDSNTRQISRGPDPPEWRKHASVAYFKDKLYYLGGHIPGSGRMTDRVDVLMNGQWQTGPAFPLPLSSVQTITCDGILYVIEEWGNNKIYRLSDDEREWIEIGKIPEERDYFGVASLNGKLYITGGWSDGGTLKSCLCFDPSAPGDSRISRIADMNYARYCHPLIVANGKLYAIGGFQNTEKRSDGSYWAINFCDAIEEYDPQTNKWRIVGEINIK